MNEARYDWKTSYGEVTIDRSWVGLKDPPKPLSLITRFLIMLHLKKRPPNHITPRELEAAIQRVQKRISEELDRAMFEQLGVL